MHPVHTAAKPASERIVELDGLRGIAALSVLLFHYTDRFPAIFGDQVMNLPHATYGNLGVNLFFAISGFVIFMTLERNGAPRDFVRSRFLRLFPAFWAAVLVSYVLLTLLGLPRWSVSAADLAINLTMLPELWHAVPVDGVYWTLQVELCFYVAMLVLSMAGQRARIRLWLAVWLALRVVERFLAPALGLHVPDLVRDLLILQWVPWFGFGILFYRRWQRLPGAGVDLLLIALCLALIAAVEPADMVVAALLVCAAFWALAHDRLWPMRWPVLTFAGTISYPLYLVHQNIGYAAMLALERQGASPGLALLVTAVAMIGLASAICFGIERPLMRLVRRRRAAPAAVQPPAGRQIGV